MKINKQTTIDLREIWSGSLTARHVRSLRLWTSSQQPTSRVGLLSASSSKSRSRCVACSESLAKTLPAPHNQPTHLSPQSQNYHHNPKPRANHDPSYPGPHAPQSLCYQSRIYWRHIQFQLQRWYAYGKVPCAL